VFLSVDGHLECCACQLHAGSAASASFDTTAAMLKHLDRHVAAGQQVPPSTFGALHADAEENDAWISSQAPAAAQEIALVKTSAVQGRMRKGTRFVARCDGHLSASDAATVAFEQLGVHAPDENAGCWEVVAPPLEDAA
jgi:hypothetical protein